MRPVRSIIAVLATSLAVPTGAFGDHLETPVAFERLTLHGEAKHVARSSAVTDVTGDGWPDVLVATGVYFDTPTNSSLLVYVNNGGELLAPQQHRLSVDAALYDRALLAVFDADGDGDDDVAVSSGTGMDVFLQSSAGLDQRRRIDLPGYPNAIHPADWDADGHTDLIVDDTSGVSLVRFTPSGSTTETLIDDYHVRVHAVGDLDSDGRADLAGWAAYSGDQPAAIEVRHQRVGGTLELKRYPRTWDERADQGDHAAIGDVNSDGRLDLITTSSSSVARNGHAVEIWAQTTDGNLAPPELRATMPNHGPLVVTDLNGDGQDDIATAHGSFYKLGILVQFLDGTVGAEQTWGLVPRSTRARRDAIGVGDLNRDGAVDITVAESNHGLQVITQRAPGSPDVTAPETAITTPDLKDTTESKATFTFHASESHVTYECRLNYGAWQPCTSPVTYRVKPGKHMFEVRATDVAGNTDPYPAYDGWNRLRGGTDKKGSQKGAK